MQSKQMNLASMSGRLSKSELKQIVGGYMAPAGCGRDISCSGKKEKESCGSRTICQCYYHTSGDKTLYCQNQN